MNAAETITAAINVLEDFKKSSTSPGGWEIVGESIHGTERGYQTLIDAGDYAASSERFENPIDAALIVTLHRTIDAQLAILRHTLRAVETLGDGPRAPLGIPEGIDLARAILGEEA